MIRRRSSEPLRHAGILRWRPLRKPTSCYTTHAPGSIGRKRDRLEYQFDIQRNGKTLRAYFNGIPPDTFKDEAEVVLTGSLTPNGFMANEMTAKCPSKYEEAPGVPGTR